MSEELKPEDVRIDLIEDRPTGGMWHCGPNAFWLTATHLPTGAIIRVYSGDRIQNKVRDDALALLGMAVSVARGEVPMFKDRIHPHPTR